MKKSLVIVAALAVGLSAGPLRAQGTTTAGQAAQAAVPQTPDTKPATSTPPKSEIIQKVVVKVNGEIFTQTDLIARQIQALREQQRAVRKAEDLTADPALVAALLVVTPAVLLEAVDELILVQHGKEMPNLKFTDAIFARALEDLKKANKIPDDATLQMALKQEGMTMADLRVNIERSFYKGEAERRELMRNMTLTEDEARQYYNAHTDQFMKPATVTLREIVVTVPETSVGGAVSFNVALDESAKEKITALRERALKGEDFAKLVAEASDSASKSSGGIIGPVNTADLSSGLAELLSKMQQGDITEPLRTKAGYQIIKLDVRSVAQPETFEKSREQISQRILESRLDVERAKLLDKLRTQAVIEWKDDGLKKMYEAALAAHKAAAGSGK